MLHTVLLNHGTALRRDHHKWYFQFVQLLKAIPDAAVKAGQVYQRQVKLALTLEHLVNII